MYLHQTPLGGRADPAGRQGFGDRRRRTAEAGRNGRSGRRGIAGCARCAAPAVQATEQPEESVEDRQRVGRAAGDVEIDGYVRGNTALRRRGSGEGAAGQGARAHRDHDLRRRGPRRRSRAARAPCSSSPGRSRRSRRRGAATPRTGFRNARGRRPRCPPRRARLRSRCSRPPRPDAASGNGRRARACSRRAPPPAAPRPPRRSGPRETGRRGGGPVCRRWRPRGTTSSQTGQNRHAPRSMRRGSVAIARVGQASAQARQPSGHLESSRTGRPRNRAGSRTPLGGKRHRPVSLAQPGLQQATSSKITGRVPHRRG